MVSSGQTSKASPTSPMDKPMTMAVMLILEDEPNLVKGVALLAVRFVILMVTMLIMQLEVCM